MALIPITEPELWDPRPAASPLSMVHRRLPGPLLLLLLLLPTGHSAQHQTAGEGQQQAARQRESQPAGAHLPAEPCWGDTRRVCVGRAPPGRTSPWSSPQPPRREVLRCRSSWEGDHTLTHSTHSHTSLHTPTCTHKPQCTFVHIHTYSHPLSHRQHTLIHKYTPHTLKTLSTLETHSNPYSCVHTCTLDTLVNTPMHSHVCTLRHTCMPIPNMHTLSTLTNLIRTDSHIPPWSTRLPVAVEPGSAQPPHASQEGDPSTLSSADDCVLAMLGQ